jgi:glucose-fructose oxidoreductase
MAIIDSARNAKVKLMTAYRLHFEEANLEAIRICQSGQIGDLRIFHSVFCQQVAADNIRLTESTSRGGGPLFDMGVYCINAARYLFRDEPIELVAVRGNDGEKRFQHTDAMVSVLMRFPKERLASFSVSFGAAAIARYDVVGTKGMLTAEPGYEYAKDIHLSITVDGKTSDRVFPNHDQFAAELVYFSDCILHDRDPEPSGEEGLIDVQIISAAYRSADNGRVIRIRTAKRERRPDVSQEIHLPPVEAPELLHAKMPTGEDRKS